MKKKKVFLISFNQLTTEFWRYHLNFDNVHLFHWSKPEHGLNNLRTIWPDIIIVDGYFSKDSYENYLKKIISLKSNIKTFCLTPKPKAYDKTVFIHENLFISKLDEEVINKINNAIQPIKEQNQFELTA